MIEVVAGSWVVAYRCRALTERFHAARSMRIAETSASHWFKGDAVTLANHALRRSGPSRSGCHPRVSQAGSLSLSS